jgi:two-component system chemotaxis response regulator CheB
MGGLRLLIADSSSVYKKIFRQAAEELDKNAAVTCVESGNEALDSIKRQDYDILAIDMEASGLGADELLKGITREIPKALVLITARPSSVSDKLCAEAMAKGAFDYMIKPVYNSYSDNFDVVKRKMTDIFKMVYEEREKKSKRREFEPAKAREILRQSIFRPKIVLIAVSTGGPPALENILAKLRGDFPVPIMVVQHMPPQFTDHLAHHLNHKSQLMVKVAENKETVTAGTVYIAPGGMHMKLNGENKIQLDDSPPVNGIRPAADVLFASVAESFTESGVLAVILTGMGHDGRDGLIKLKKNRDCFCVAQSEETCVVYGMPHAAVESGLVDKILDLDQISAEIEGLAVKHT